MDYEIMMNGNVKIGQSAPDFEALSTCGNIKLSDYKGKWIVFMVVSIYGTGSYPFPPQGWQRRSLFMVRYSPLIGPCLRRAWIAYAEQVGVKRQVGGFNGDMQIW